VHATHLTDDDIRILGRAGASVVICPTTEADLADGLPPAERLVAAGGRLALGGDQQVVVDPFAQARGLEYGERLAGGRRGVFPPAALWSAALQNSHTAIGSPGGVIAVGAPADLVAIRVDSVRTAGAEPEQLVMCASAQDVEVVVVGGLVRARAGNHLTYGDPGPLLAAAIEQAWR
jgi:cytosine/adenosine deaminase-related metal-dependent hydrolase